MRTIKKPKLGRPKKKHAGGRPSIMTPETLQKLREAATIDCSIDEMCLYADIAVSTLYLYWEVHPEHKAYIEALRHSPTIKARKIVYQKMDESYQNAMDYLKRKRKDEFSERNEHTGANGQELVVNFREI